MYSREASSVYTVVAEHKDCLSEKNSKPDLKISMKKDCHLLMGIVLSTGIRKKKSHKILDTRLLIPPVLIPPSFGTSIQNSFWGGVGVNFFSLGAVRRADI